ncbi:MAG: hypothetical protein KME16_26865 [Scytolyngbya sp. HA4215-MV1]|nr:hypothetical protein [Scytolyngbya sp. HA4215-MV1]
MRSTVADPLELSTSIFLQSVAPQLLYGTRRLNSPHSVNGARRFSNSGFAASRH